VTVGTAGALTSVRDSADTFDIRYTGTVSAVITAAGAGGLDAGAEAANTWYAVHLIGDSTGVNSPAALLSTSATAPTLPAGYNKFRRIGWVRNNAASDFRKFNQDWGGQTRIYINDVVRSEVNAFSGAVAVAATFQALSLTGFVPPTSSTPLITLFSFTNTDGNTFEIRPTGSTVAFGSAVTTLSSGVRDRTLRTTAMIMSNTSQSIDIASTQVADVSDLFVRGYVDTL
jgi:hypothetical protein